MKGLSDLRIKTKKIGGECPIHHIPLVTDEFGRSKPFCMECEKEALSREKTELDRKNTREITTKYFNRYSLVDNPFEWSYTFKDFKAVRGTREYEVKEKSRRLAGIYLKDKKVKFNTIFFGDPGAGKTLLAMSMLKGVNDNAEPPQKCLFINVNKLIDKIFSSFNNPTEMWTKDKAIEIIGSADLVVLDDLGSESSMTDKGQASEFVQKLLYRISNRPVKLIITTNLSQDQFKRTYNSKIISRLFANTKNSIVDFSGITDKR